MANIFDTSQAAPVELWLRRIPFIRNNSIQLFSSVQTQPPLSLRLKLKHYLEYEEVCNPFR